VSLTWLFSRVVVVACIRDASLPPGDRWSYFVSGAPPGVSVERPSERD
jgi:hypothetical protein